MGIPDIKTAQRNRYGKLIGYRIATIGMWVSIAALALLMVFSTVITYTSGWGYRFGGKLLHNSILNAPLMVAISIFACVCISGFIYLISKFFVNRKVDKKIVLIAVCIVSMAFQIWWIFAQHANGSLYFDSNETMSLGSMLAHGDMSMFNQSIDGVPISEMKSGTKYFISYPYQTGIVLFFTCLFKIFGNNTPLAIQIINAVCNVGTIVMLSLIGFLIADDEKTKIAIPIVAGMCLPSLLYSSFMYGNQIGFFLATCFITLNVYALNQEVSYKKRIMFVIISVIPMSATMIIKPTFLIIIIAIMIVWIIELLLHFGIKNVGCFIALILMFALSNAAGKIPQAYFEKELGYSLGQGMPKTAWIAIGLQDNAVIKGMPGWWNDSALKRQIDTKNDYEKQSVETVADIQTEIDKMVHNPMYTLRFFGKKLGSEWLTPDFHARYFAGMNYEKVNGDDNNRYVFNLHERDYNIYDAKELATERAIDQVEELVPFMDGYQTLIYAGAFISCLAIVRNNKKEKDKSKIQSNMLLMPCIFIVGAVVYLLWEAQAQYLLPFFMCLIPVAVPGIFSIADKIIEKGKLVKTAK